MDAAFVALAMVVSIGILIFSFLYLRFRQRELQHRERLAALEKGTPLPDLFEERRPLSGRIYLLRGMMWLFSGIAIVMFLAAISAYSRHAPNMERRLERTEELKKLGATDAQIQEAEKEPPGDAMPEGISLLGLIPIGIGAAYLIYFRVERKNEALAGKAGTLS
jgi:hypothetical protein